MKQQDLAREGRLSLVWALSDVAVATDMIDKSVAGFMKACRIVGELVVRAELNDQC